VKGESQSRTGRYKGGGEARKTCGYGMAEKKPNEERAKEGESNTKFRSTTDTY